MHIRKSKDSRLLRWATCPFGLWHGPAMLLDIVVHRCTVLCLAAATQDVVAVLAELSALEAARDFAYFHGPGHRPAEQSVRIAGGTWAYTVMVLTTEALAVGLVVAFVAAFSPQDDGCRGRSVAEVAEGGHSTVLVYCS
jgi:hypothetical protein